MKCKHGKERDKCLDCINEAELSLLEGGFVVAAFLVSNGASERDLDELKRLNRETREVMRERRERLKS